ncbi:acyl-CoA hydrolase 2 isoform X2 [Cryptomeria japonica]|uniref:acyl-CoA hydrolase 2 isoform X2 n=1 Tax=Cryptomeria japonica TaxID=3369 RepID=UPI0025AD2512|nr:acyl-CoA hydrolase 2 isoform X2 [Cryptomeria japonica]
MMQFLGSMPLLQRLPSSSVKKIAGLIKFKDFDRGEYLAKEGEAGDGVYFIWKGEAEVSPSTESEVLGNLDLSLKRGDYFGYGYIDEAHRADVIALSKVICLVLSHEYTDLLSAESIWNAEQKKETCSMVEHILHLESLEVDMFRGISLPDAPHFGNVFGGQLISQALAAASKSVDPLMLAHSLHSYFIRTGDVKLPIIYHVHRVRDGNSYSTRHVEAIQKGHVIFTLFASFQKPENGFQHHEPMPNAPDPDTLVSREKLLESYLTDPRIPVSSRKRLAQKKRVPWPIEIRFCEPHDDVHFVAREPRQRYWFRARGKLSDDQALHRCVAAYASDLIFLDTSLHPHHRDGLKISSLSLDHSMWFHKPFKADEWLLFEMESPIASGGRGFNVGRMYTRAGELVVSLAQEGSIRRKLQPTSKL